MTAVKGHIYEVTIAGQYYGFNGGKKSISNYEVTVKLDGNAKELGFLSVARNKILPRALQARYPDYKRFRTHHIMNVVDLTNNGAPVKEIGLMNRKQICAWVTSRKLPIELDLYPEVSDLRQAVKAFRDNKELFLKNQATRQERYGPELKTMRAIDELNPDLDKQNSTSSEISESAKKEFSEGISRAKKRNEHVSNVLTSVNKPDYGWVEPIESDDPLIDETTRIPAFDDSDDLDRALEGL